MQILIGILIGAVLWQLITFLVAVFDEEMYYSPTIVTGCGIWMAGGNLIIDAIKKIRDSIQFRSMRTLVQHPELDGWHHTSIKDGNKIVQHGGEHFVPSWTQEFQDKYPLELWPERFRVPHLGKRGLFGSMRYVPKEVWQDFPAFSL